MKINYFKASLPKSSWAKNWIECRSDRITFQLAVELFLLASISGMSNSASNLFTIEPQVIYLLGILLISDPHSLLPAVYIEAV